MYYTSINSFVPRGNAALIALTVFFASAAPAISAPALADPAGQSGGVCIDATDIDHTHVLNNRQVLFYMKNRKVWLNTLRNTCTSAARSGGVRVCRPAFPEFLRRRRRRSPF